MIDGLMRYYQSCKYVHIGWTINTSACSIELWFDLKLRMHVPSCGKLCQFSWLIMLLSLLHGILVAQILVVLCHKHNALGELTVHDGT